MWAHPVEFPRLSFWVTDQPIVPWRDAMPKTAFQIKKKWFMKKWHEDLLLKRKQSKILPYAPNLTCESKVKQDPIHHIEHTMFTQKKHYFAEILFFSSKTLFLLWNYFIKLWGKQCFSTFTSTNLTHILV